MTTREAACACGNLTLAVDGDPVRISMCSCLACQRRTGTTSGIQARFRTAQVRTAGDAATWVRISDAGEERTFRFCPSCGSTVWYTTSDAPDLVAVPVGAFADPSFPGPTVSVWRARRHAWQPEPTTVERRID